MSSHQAPTPQQLQSWLQQAQAITSAQKALWAEMNPHVDPFKPSDPVLLAAYAVCSNTTYAVSWLKTAMKGE